MSYLSMGVSASATAPATRTRPVFSPPPAEDPRPWIPPTPDPKVAVVSPAEFLAAHPDIAGWSSVDHEVYEHLIEAAEPPYLIATPFLSPVGKAALIRLAAEFRGAV